MKHVAAALTLSLLLASQASAFTVDLTPSLTWPEPATTTQACADPASLSTPTCEVAH